MQSSCVPEREAFCDIDNVSPIRRGRTSECSLYDSKMNGPQCNTWFVWSFVFKLVQSYYMTTKKGITVEISFLSCILALIYVISYLFPINGRHIYISVSTYSYVGQYSHQSIRVRWPQKHGYSRWNLVAIRNTTKDMGVINILPVYIRHFEFRLQFSSAVITIISGNTDVLNKIDHGIVHGCTIGDLH